MILIDPRKRFDRIDVSTIFKPESLPAGHAPRLLQAAQTHSATPSVSDGRDVDRNGAAKAGLGAVLSTAREARRAPPRLAPPARGVPAGSAVH